MLFCRNFFFFFDQLRRYIFLVVYLSLINLDDTFFLIVCRSRCLSFHVISFNGKRLNRESYFHLLEKTRTKDTQNPGLSTINASDF